MKKQIIMLLTCILSGCLLFTACRKEDKKDPVTQTGETIDNSMEADTSETEEQTGNTTQEYISEKEALKNIQDIVGERGYNFELLDNNLTIDDETYYLYQVSDSIGPFKPGVLVNKITGELFCYYSDGSIAAFSEHPLYVDPDITEQTGADVISQQDALDRLRGIQAKDLGLPKELSEYSIDFDGWTTNVNDVECYGINVYAESEKQMTVIGQFYVALDGSSMFKYDSEADDIVAIKVK
ncbi:hypothetical protein [Anaerocolumna sp. MB42-C2]|uniref:hypothetical protein n=1 Tax=Anaerocolumna sp. MB42-C2 TaxID=3070997 RepID=UPI0027E0D643|nr:hypothetical protein [Anaerocolumna sp. MB42-C2]WMJ89858.1 hypothetical protein RBU59_10135 [Anaerocolumna sp. MB42-C2]